ncbi:unnamed protein product [Phytophthora fragariaefolia]|uniref:Unnamed protein product n=1 Tax=Phytophthora fragariaefolia TaxID=1490495 RepID=A0A9W6YCY2_9STRA|nr:unnamed protein product [Phytophthora fragariaefolia]
MNYGGLPEVVEIADRPVLRFFGACVFVSSWVQGSTVPLRLSAISTKFALSLVEVRTCVKIQHVGALCEHAALIEWYREWERYVEKIRHRCSTTGETFENVVATVKGSVKPKTLKNMAMSCRITTKVPVPDRNEPYQQHSPSPERSVELCWDKI